MLSKECVARCFADPCVLNKCPAIPNARCVSNICDGCNAHFFNELGFEVTNLCQASQGCSDGSRLYTRCPHLCLEKSCLGFPEATCMENGCGGCSYSFVNENGVDVTSQCGGCKSRVTLEAGNECYCFFVATPMPLLIPTCPQVEPAVIGIECQSLCLVDGDCEDHQQCCAVGCSAICLNITYIPYYATPRVCPSNRRLSLCLEDLSCQNESECDQDMLCCETRCGKRCILSEPSTVPCFTIRDQILASLEGSIAHPLNPYIPTCKLDGYYTPLQCQDSIGLCWCVRMFDGQPLEQFSPQSSGLQCSGT